MHTWDQPAGFINFLAGRMPYVFAVRGNHDLPNHSNAQVERSAYWTLVHCGRVFDLSSAPKKVGGVVVQGFGHGRFLAPVVSCVTSCVSLIVAHRYVWKEGMGYPGARPEDYAGEVVRAATGCDVILTGDNHQAFEYGYTTAPYLFNAGCLIRRRADERHLKPRVGLLYADGTVRSVELDTTADRWRAGLDEETTVLESAGLDAAAFLDTVRQLGDARVSFADAVRHYLAGRRVSDKVKAGVLDIMESVKVVR